MVQSGRNSNSSKILCMSSLPASIKRIKSKATVKWWRHHFPHHKSMGAFLLPWTPEKRWRQHFPHYKSMGAFCCHRNQSFDPICPKTLCSFPPTPVKLHIKFDQYWPTGFRDIQVRKCKISVIQRKVTPK